MGPVIAMSRLDHGNGKGMGDEEFSRAMEIV
jgi:hypothetical protein